MCVCLSVVLNQTSLSLNAGGGGHGGVGGGGLQKTHIHRTFCNSTGPDGGGLKD